MTPAPERPDKACAWCEPLRHDYNAAVANGLIERARLIDRRIAAHEREVHEHVATAVTPAPERPDPIYCTGGCDACRDYARELGVPLIVSVAPVTDAGLRETLRLTDQAIFDLPIGEDVTYSRGYSAGIAAAREGFREALRAALSRQAEKETA